jgi:Fur family ferric uptake transcriptional regulator
MDTKNAIERFTEHKSRHGLKSSDKRSFVVNYFVDADQHYTVEELYDEIRKLRPKIGYSTVYRALKLLVNCGLATECTFDDAAMRYEPAHQAEHHDHLICRTCGRIVEFENDEIEKLQRDVAHKYGFHVSAHKLQLYGECRTCRKSRRRRNQCRRKI